MQGWELLGFLTGWRSLKWCQDFGICLALRPFTCR